MGSVHQPDINGPIVYRCAQQGCRECLARLLTYHRRLVYWVLNRQYLAGLPEEDAAQAGMIGLWKAICSYDPDRGAAFSTYAAVAIERHIWAAVKRERRVSRQVQVMDSDRLAMAEEGDLLALVEARTVLAEVLAQLPVRLGVIVIAAYGLDGQSPRNYVEIGQQLGISRERVRQCHNQALARLRTPALCGPLRSVWEEQDRLAYQRVAALLRAWQREQRAIARARYVRRSGRGGR